MSVLQKPGNSINSINYSCRPSGWDNQKKISILYENMHACKPDDFYGDIIAQPPSRKTVSNREVEVVTEDEQAFLARQQQLLQQGQQGSPQTRSVSPMRTPQSSGKTTPRTPVGGQGSPNKKVNESDSRDCISFITLLLDRS